MLTGKEDFAMTDDTRVSAAAARHAGPRRSVTIAVDIGTTSTKALAVDRHGEVLGSRSIGYSLYTPKSDRAEQDPEEIFRAVVQAVRQLIDQLHLPPSAILCVSFSSAMHSLIAVGRDGKPLTRSITWADNRSIAYSGVLKEQGIAHSIYLATGTPVHPMSPLLKLMWLRDHEPDVTQKAFKYIGIKEYVLHKLFGRYVIDYSIASATGLFALEHLDWNGPSLCAAGIEAGQLSEPVNTTLRLEGLDARWAGELGLAADTPFIVGASDGVLANLGVGAVRQGVYAATVGTSGALRGVVGQPRTDPHARLFCYALKDDFWVIGGAINNGGIMYRWVRDQLATLEAEEGRRRGMNPYDYLTELAMQIAPGSDGLVFLPLLAGERAPNWNANARGVFFGLSLAHSKKHMIRAVLEGVIYRFHSVASALNEFSGKAVEIRASGGFAHSPFWRQLMADILETPVSVPATVESSGLGAAMLGVVAMGEASSLDSLTSWTQTNVRHEPNLKHQAVYKELLEIYYEVYGQLQGPFDRIAAFQANLSGKQG